MSTEIKSGGFSIEIIMGRWSDARVCISRQVMLFIRPPLAMVISGELLQVPIIGLTGSYAIISSIFTVSVVMIKGFVLSEFGC